MSNHKWEKNVCLNCGIHRTLTKWSRCMAIVNHPPYNVMQYGKDWFYYRLNNKLRTDIGFVRPNCEHKNTKYMRTNPPTSIEAYKSLNPESIREIYTKILNALKVLGSANTEKIAEYLGVEHSKVHKRTKEMEGLEMIWRPGAKVPTKTGRQSFLWTIRGDNQPKTDNQEKEKLASTKPISHYAKNISDIQKTVQTQLFP